MKDRHGHNGRFIVAAVENPAGYKPGRYFYAMHVATGHKVSRYFRLIGSADRKVALYTRMYAEGDRSWPPVTRCDELRTNPDAVWTWRETFGFVDSCYE